MLPAAAALSMRETLQSTSVLAVEGFLMFDVKKPALMTSVSPAFGLPALELVASVTQMPCSACPTQTNRRS